MVARLGKRTTLLSDDGKLYDHYTGKEYTGNNQYILDAKATLDNLRSMGGGVAMVVNDLVKGDEKHTIANFDNKLDGTKDERKESYNIQSRERDNKKGSLTKFVPDVDRKRGLADHSNEEILGHEMKHAYNRKYDLVPPMNHKTDNGIPLEEVDGVNFQSVVRDKQGRPPKTTFAGRDISKYLIPPGLYNNYKKDD